MGKCPPSLRQVAMAGHLCCCLKSLVSWYQVNEKIMKGVKMALQWLNICKVGSFSSVLLWTESSFRYLSRHADDKSRIVYICNWHCPECKHIQHWFVQIFQKNIPSEIFVFFSWWGETHIRGQGGESFERLGGLPKPKHMKKLLSFTKVLLVKSTIVIIL